MPRTARFLILAMLITACDDTPTMGGPESAVMVSPAAATLMGIGETVRLSARDQSGQLLETGVTWSSSEPSVAAVDPSTGVVTAVAGGDASITAAIGSVAGSAAITVGVIVGTDGAVLRDEGGTVRVSIPPGALNSDIRVTITTRDPTNIPVTGTPVGKTVELGPEGTTFAKPAQIAFLDAQGLQASDSSLTVIHWVPGESLVENITPQWGSIGVGTPSDPLTAAYAIETVSFSDFQFLIFTRFSVFNYRWEIPTLSYFYEDDPVFTGNVEEALGLWSALGGPQFTRTSSAGDANIVFRDQGSAPLTCHGVSPTVVVTGVACPDDFGYFSRAGLGSDDGFEVAIASGVIDVEAAAAGVTYVEGYTHTLAHEVGHVLGLYHFGDSTLPVNMMETKFTGTTRLAPEDAEAFCAHYDCDFGWRRIDTANSGLPSNLIYTLKVAPDGILWAWTATGVASFDGQYWSVVPPPPETDRSQALAGDMTIVNGAPALAWMRKTDRATMVGRWTGSQWEVYSPYGDTGDGKGLTSIAADPDGNIFIHAERAQGRLIRPDGVVTELSGGTWHSPTCDATYDGGPYVHNVWMFYVGPDGFVRGMLTGIPDANRSLLCEALSRYTVAPNLVGEVPVVHHGTRWTNGTWVFRNARIATNGTAWICGSHVTGAQRHKHLMVWDGSELVAVTNAPVDLGVSQTSDYCLPEFRTRSRRYRGISNSLPPVWIVGWDVDANGDAWVVTAGQNERGIAVKHYVGPTGAPGHGSSPLPRTDLWVESVAVDRDGRVWIGTMDGLWRYRAAPPP